ncbi:MAG TPA: HAD hydrolase family protein [Nitrospinota bacterium]|jgi:3-deoxy-D-manno-octulosonate 8-phosphate phosphatase (KDO 8-P phosphatase)|nr:HAD hydrolase family protein [Nitrospinota bacterium]|tara:strand:+ start:7656 stop:8165 length:510 start_codon:yes stop_codon:yes gene_type:complete
MALLSMNEIKERAQKVELIVLDVDGVLTDGKVTFSSSGDEMVSFDVKDGHGIVMAIFSGLKIALISGRSSKVTRARAKDLKIEFVYQNVKEKLPKLKELLEKLNLTLDTVAFVGDDTLDIPPMRAAGLGVAVANAHHAALAAADWVTSADGGKGAVREMLDLIMEMRKG